MDSEILALVASTHHSVGDGSAIIYAIAMLVVAYIRAFRRRWKQWEEDH